MPGALAYLLGTPGPSGFGSKSSALHVTANLNLKNMTVVVTGCSTGIGKEIARALAFRGARVVMAVRDTSLGQDVREQILLEYPQAHVEVMELDLSSLSSVRKFAKNLQFRGLSLNILINNAGTVSSNFQHSEDGMELTFASNYMGHFLLTNLLLDNLIATAEQSGIQGRIVNVAASSHAHSKSIYFDSINDPNTFSSYRCYTDSKLALILHAQELTRRLADKGLASKVCINSVHPGVVKTSLSKKMNVLALKVALTVGKQLLKTPMQGAATVCYVAAHPDLTGISGRYFDDCNEALPSKEAQDSQLAARLWTYSEQNTAFNQDKYKLYKSKGNSR